MQTYRRYPYLWVKGVRSEGVGWGLDRGGGGAEWGVDKRGVGGRNREEIPVSKFSGLI